MIGYWHRQTRHYESGTFLNSVKVVIHKFRVLKTINPLGLFHYDNVCSGSGVGRWNILLFSYYFIICSFQYVTIYIYISVKNRKTLTYLKWKTLACFHLSKFVPYIKISTKEVNFSKGRRRVAKSRRNAFRRSRRSGKDEWLSIWNWIPRSIAFQFVGGSVRRLPQCSTLGGATLHNTQFTL